MNMRHYSNRMRATNSIPCQVHAGRISRLTSIIAARVPTDWSQARRGDQPKGSTREEDHGSNRITGPIAEEREQ